MSDEEILRKCYLGNTKTKDGIGRLSRKFPNNLNKDEIEYLKNRFEYSSSLYETIVRLRKGIYERPICKICGKPAKFIEQPNSFFANTCCEECGNKYRHLRKTEGIIKKFGVDNVFRLEETKEKIKETTLERYGKTCYLATKECQEKSHSREVIEKGIQSMRDRGIFKGGTSSQEIKIWDKIKEYFPDVLHSWKDEDKYPFNCDFYIPSLDIWIELNFHWTHGKHPFNENNKNDIDRLNYMKTKNDRYYNKAINVWTISDPLKHKIAMENGLNYFRFYTEQEFEEWFNKIKEYVEA